jgi:hypothetical protein
VRFVVINLLSFVFSMDLKFNQLTFANGWLSILFLVNFLFFCHISFQLKTALHIACEIGNYQIVQFLGSHGSDVHSIHFWNRLFCSSAVRFTAASLYFLRFLLSLFNLLRLFLLLRFPSCTPNFPHLFPFLRFPWFRLALHELRRLWPKLQN